MTKLLLSSVCRPFGEAVEPAEAGVDGGGVTDGAQVACDGSAAGCEPCDGGGSCSREGDVCTQPFGYGASELCLPRIYAESGEFDIKILPRALNMTVKQ